MQHITQHHRISFATRADEADLLGFIREHWKKDHVFVTHPELMRWQHRDPDRGDGLTFVIARDITSNAIVGLLGFIPFRRFDPSLGPDCFFAIWKIRDGVTGLGLALPMFYQKAVKPRLTGAIGLSQMVIPIYNALGFTTGNLNQWTVFNPNVVTSKLVAAPGTVGIRSPDTFIVRFADSIEDLRDYASAVDKTGAKVRPQKSWRQILERYARHPVYQYEAMLVTGRTGGFGGLLVFREIRANNALCLRGVDYVGSEEALAGSCRSIQQELEWRGAEFFDLYAHGFDAALLRKGGFRDAQDESGLIVPNYFEPFEKRSVVLNFAYKLRQDGESTVVRLFKGDSDQDRPNIITGPVVAPTPPGDPIANLPVAGSEALNGPIVDEDV